MTQLSATINPGFKIQDTSTKIITCRFVNTYPTEVMYCMWWSVLGYPRVLTIVVMNNQIPCRWWAMFWQKYISNRSTCNVLYQGSKCKCWKKTEKCVGFRASSSVCTTRLHNRAQGSGVPLRLQWGPGALPLVGARRQSPQKLLGFLKNWVAQATLSSPFRPLPPHPP